MNPYAPANAPRRTSCARRPDRRSGRAVRRASGGWGLALLALVLLAIPASAPPAAAQSPGDRSAAESRRIRLDERVEVHTHELEHRSAEDALVLVRPLLTARGTARVRPGTSTLVVRDIASAVSRIALALARFDRPPKPLGLEVMVVRATVDDVSPAIGASSEGLPDELVERLSELLRYDTFRLLARAAVTPREGAEATYDVGGGYRVGFRLGSRIDQTRLKLHDFRITRADRDEPLLHTNLNLRLDQTLTLGLARDEASRSALMVVLTCREKEPAPRRAAPARRRQR